MKRLQQTTLKIEQWVIKHSDLSFVVYSNWFIGISDKKTTTEGLRFLQDYDAVSGGIASAIEICFHKKGMHISEYKGSINTKTRHVYIHKIKG